MTFVPSGRTKSTWLMSSGCASSTQVKQPAENPQVAPSDEGPPGGNGLFLAISTPLSGSKEP